MEASPLIVRPAARVLVVDGRNRLLLFRARLAYGDDVWITPGGGLHDGESHEECAARELWEETGLRDVPFSSCVWFRTHTFPWGDHTIEQRERFFVARVDAHDVVAHNWTQEELTMLVGHRWWSHAEIAASSQRFSPRRLAQFLPPLLAGQYPPDAIDTGV